MKICIKIVIFLFLLFLATPTIVSLLANENDKELIIVCSVEEEIQKDIKEVKVVPSLVFEFAVFIPLAKKAAITSKYLQEHTNVFGDIFLPPPEVV
jgi:hypothetical protein